MRSDLLRIVPRRLLYQRQKIQHPNSCFTLLQLPSFFLSHFDVNDKRIPRVICCHARYPAESEHLFAFSSFWRTQPGFLIYCFGALSCCHSKFESQNKNAEEVIKTVRLQGESVRTHKRKTITFTNAWRLNFINTNNSSVKLYER